MSKSVNEKQRKTIIDIAIMAVIVAMVVAIIYSLVYKNEIYISETRENTELSSLICTTMEAFDSAFFENSALSAKHELRIIFNNDVIDKMSYEFRGEYESWKAADQDEGILHAKYNNYMGEHGLENMILTPIFQNVEGDLKISLYLDTYENMDPAVARLFYIEEDTIGAIMENSITGVKEYYENKGFLCIISD